VVGSSEVDQGSDFALFEISGQRSLSRTATMSGRHENADAYLFTLLAIIARQRVARSAAQRRALACDPVQRGFSIRSRRLEAWIPIKPGDDGEMMFEAPRLVQCWAIMFRSISAFATRCASSFGG
jgi:hypothetical protein